MNDRNSDQSEVPHTSEAHFSDAKILAGNLTDDKLNLSMAEEDSETTIRRVLSAYDVGGKLRQLRLRKKIALVDLGKHTGLSASMLSQLENGKLIPTLPTLARIAMVFDVSLDYFFGQRKSKRPFAVVKATDRIQFPERPDLSKPAYFFECLDYAAADKSTQAYLAEFPRRNPGEEREHFHEGSEFIFVLDGVLTVRYASEDHTLKSGDSVYFDASEPHSYRGGSKTPARALVVTAPPRL
jgi:transcriptional regulator with XRE-family HTH domain